MFLTSGEPHRVRGMVLIGLVQCFYMAERTFRTLREVKEAFFPNVPLEELEGGPPTKEQIQEDLRRFVEMAKRNTQEVDSKKTPR